MGRIRTIKPEFHAHEELSSLPAETHLLAAALMNYADDYGYFNANPVLVKAGTNPLRQDGTKIEDQLADLERIGFIEIRAVDKKRIGKVLHFQEHQRVSHPTPSKLQPLFEGLPKSSGEIPESLPNVSSLKGKEQGMEGNRERVAHHVISPEMITRGVLSELCLSGKDLAIALDEVCSSEMKQGRDPTELRDSLIAAHRDYQSARAGGRFTQYVKRPVNFFGDGDWRNKEAWPWKEGQQPKPKRIYVNGAA